MAAFTVILAWNVFLTWSLYHDRENTSEGMHTVENDDRSYTTDVTEISDRLRSSIVTVLSDDQSSSGIIFEQDDHTVYVLTDADQLDSKNTAVVRFDSGAEVSADVLGTDPDTDLTLLSLKTDFDVTVPAMGDSDAVSMGEYVIALGGRRKESDTAMISYGITSGDGLHRMTYDSNWYTEMLETDATVTKNNMGGALFNIGGDLIGMLCDVPNDGEEEMGYAIGVNEMKLVFHELKENGEVTRGIPGFSCRDIDKMESYEKNEMGLQLDDNSGVLVENVLGDGAVSDVISSGDVITSVDNSRIQDTRSLRTLLYNHKKGDMVTISYLHEGKSESGEITLQ